MNATFWGIFGFGLIIGWLTYYAVRRTTNFGIKTIGTVVGVLGGAAVTRFLSDAHDWIGPYGIGLAVGFISYLVVALVLILTGNPDAPPGPSPAKPPKAPIVLPGPLLLNNTLDDVGSHKSKSSSLFDAVSEFKVLDAGDDLRSEADLGDRFKPT